ncbi:VWA domain-containing protein [Chitinophaga pollutisoli]|uniref:VWA domain-containing protein n=1 Tax=Chitinophaga pollutisoli TaxID=3133966 RepID=A0ABZ2YNK7_9BACT
MALDEYIFGRVVRYFRQRKAQAEDVSRTVSLEPLRPRLTLLARALTGRPVEIFPAVKEGGYKGDSFFLPEKCGLFSSGDLNAAFYIFRVLYLSVQQQLGLNGYSTVSLTDKEALVRAANAAPEVLAAMQAAYPESPGLYERLRAGIPVEQDAPFDDAWFFGRWMPDVRESAKPEALSAFPAGSAVTAPEQPTIVQARPVEEIITIAVDIRQQEDYVLTHNFEKVDTADEFSGSWRDFDGEDELEKHQDALRELNMKYTVRVNDTVHSVYETGYTGNTTAAESKDNTTEGKFVSYDEWDCFRENYKRAFSKVFPIRQPFTDAAYCEQTIAAHRMALEQLRRILASINNQWARQRFQLHGNEIDTDRVTDRFADLLAGQTPSERVYLADRKKEKDLSILLLLDLSLSSDSYAAGNRVIDISKQTAILFGEILHESGIDFSICGFYSQTRNYTAYITLKDFDDNWRTARYAVGAPQPEGYTRIGPALRHSGALLQQREGRHKWIILLSDGKPNDFDRYEGRYGIADVRQALRELSQRHIQTYALAIEAAARYYLPQMFGHDHYQVISSPNALFTKLIKLYERIRYSS